MAVLGDTKLNDLSTALRAGSQAKSQLAGLDEEYAAAQTRGRPTAQANRYGYVSPFSALADVVGQSQSRRDLRQLAPKRAAARTAVADTANAQGLYNARMEQDKRTQAQANVDRSAGLTQSRFDYQQKQGDAAEKAKQAALKLESEKGTRVTLYDDIGGRFDHRRLPDGTFVNLDGSPVDTSKLSVTAPPKVSAVQNAKNRYGGFTPAQLQTGLNKLRKEINPLMPVIHGIKNLNKLLSGLDDPNKDIPGIGFSEGGTGMFARGVRMAGSKEGKDIHAAWTGVIAPLIREQAGLAQTRTELERVEQQYGADWLTDEDVFRIAYPRVMKAMQLDLQTIQGTFTKPVMDYYVDTMGGLKYPTVFEEAQFKNPFESKESKAGGDMSQDDLDFMAKFEAENPEAAQ